MAQMKLDTEKKQTHGHGEHTLMIAIGEVERDSVGYWGW